MARKKKKKKKKPQAGVPSGSRPIEGVGTAVAAFVGLAQRHPAATAVGAVALVWLVAMIVRSAAGYSSG